MNGKKDLMNFNGFVASAFLLSALGLSACGGVAPTVTSDNGSSDVVVNDSGNVKEQVEGTESKELDLNTAALENEALKPSLVDLHFEQLGQGSNALVADMQSTGLYTFNKTAPSEYVLTLENAQIAENVERTLLAPRTDGVIRSVRAVQEGENVALRIFADSDAFLKVEARGSKLMVTATDAATVDSSNVLGQAEDTKAEEEVTTEETEAGADVSDFDELLGETQYTGRLISLDLQDTDIDNALRIIAEVSNLNIIASGDVAGKVTLRLIDVPWDQALDVILKTNGLDKVQEGNVVRIAPVEKLRIEREQLRQSLQAAEELEPLKVQYIRVSYAKAADLQPLVETVITERGTVAYEERTNQLIVKDISKGLKNVAALIKKLDLRTPQVLVETQIVESTKNFSRQLGADLGFFYMRSPETGNALGYNFPNSMTIGGSQSGTTFSHFAPDANSALSMLFGSADGSKGLDIRLAQAEAEGKARVVSRPSIAVTNNEQAEIKNVTKIRVRMPNGGTNVATGTGATTGGSGSATETIEVGITLQVTAQASPDYYVLLDLKAESSSFGNNEYMTDDIPPEIERSTNSTVLVSSGQTFALGGIYKISENDTVNGVPWLKDIPFLGYLFRGTEVKDQDEELIFFITPRIIEGSFDDAAMKENA